MRSVDYRAFRSQSVPSRRWIRWALLGAVGCIGLFILANVIMWGMYRTRVLPNYTLGTAAVGGVSFAELDKRLKADSLLPARVTLEAAGKKVHVTPDAVGIHVDGPASTAALKRQRPLLPLLSLVSRRSIPLTLRIDDAQFTKGMAPAQTAFNHDPLPSRITFAGTSFTVADPTAGRRINMAEAKEQLTTGLQKGVAHIVVAQTVIAAPAASDLNGERQKLEKQLQTKLSFAHGGKTITPATKDIGGWYAASGQTMALSDDRIGAYLDGISPAAANRSDLILAVRYTIGKNQSVDLAVVPKGSPVRTYCTATRGVNDTAVSDMIGKLATAYADTRGWNAGGKIAFAHSASGCEYTVWLSAPANMTSFGSICDDYFNCQVGVNVIVNYDRWMHATDPWNASGGSLEEYRSLIINHETGHRLGFYDNPTCPAAGTAAPVMMQQSIDLHSCVFNSWPTAAEIAAVSAKNGV